MLLFPLTLARNKENGNIKSRILIFLCTMHYDTGLYSVGCGENIAVDEAIF